MKTAGLKGEVIGFGTLLVVMWREEKNTEAQDILRTYISSGQLPRLLHIEMVSRRIYFANRGMFALSTPMSQSEVDRAVEAFAASLQVLKPYVAETLPHLLSN